MKPKCPECDSKSVLYKKTDKTFWCRVCGAEWLKKGAKREKARVAKREMPTGL